MYTLFNCPRAGGVAIEAALAEAGVPVTVVDVSAADARGKDGWYRAINPLGEVPALRLDDDTVMTESAAILIHLCDAHPQARLGPPPGTPERARMLRWLVFFAVNVYGGELRRHHPLRFTTAGGGADGIAEAAARTVLDHYRAFDDALGDGEGPLFFTDRLCVLDCYVWMLAQWVADPELLARQCPRVQRLCRAVARRPAIAPVARAHFG